jgi:hypothetical protein
MTGHTTDRPAWTDYGQEGVPAAAHDSRWDWLVFAAKARG